jgi:hypothetical protein
LVFVFGRHIEIRNSNNEAGAQEKLVKKTETPNAPNRAASLKSSSLAQLRQFCAVLLVNPLMSAVQNVPIIRR